MWAMSRAAKVPALKGNGPTHRLADLKGWLTNTPGRKPAGVECFYITLSLFLFISFSPQTDLLTVLFLLQMCIKKYEQIGLSFAHLHCFTPSCRGNHFAGKHVEMLTGRAASINLNKIQWCSPYIFPAWMSSPWERAFTKAASPQMVG